LTICIRWKGKPTNSFSRSWRADPAGSGGPRVSKLSYIPEEKCPVLELGVETSRAEQLRSRLQLRTAGVTVIGMRYVGLPLAETFASGGYRVVGFDIDPEKVRKLKSGESYIGHIPSQRIADLVKTGRFEATTDPSCFRNIDVIVICVPTPLTESR